MPDAGPLSLSIMFPAQPEELRPVLDLARFAREVNARRLWIGQSLRIESHLLLAALASHVPGLSLGTSVVLTPLRHPYEAAVDARAIARLSGAPYVAGYGPGAVEFQRAVLGEPLPRPLVAVAEYASIVRGLCNGGVADHRGEYYALRAQLLPMAAPLVEVGLGVLRPGMAKTAGRVADVAITWLTPPRYLREQIGPALVDGAIEAGRPAPRLATVVHVAVARRGRDLRRAVYAAVGAHLGAKHYTDMLQRAGVPVDPDDPVKGAQVLLDQNIYVTGTPGEIAAELRGYHDSGVDEVILNVCGVHATEGESSALHDLRAVIEAVADSG